MSAYRRHFGIGVFASYELIQLVCPDMFDAGFGSIINVTSVASRVPATGRTRIFAGGVLPGYGGSKVALEHLTWCAAYDLQLRNIAVNALASVHGRSPRPGSYLPDRSSTAPRRTMNSPAQRVELALVDANEVTGRTIGHLGVLDGSFSPFANIETASRLASPRRA